jgi:hypothetical protein
LKGLEFSWNFLLTFYSGGIGEVTSIELLEQISANITPSRKEPDKYDLEVILKLIFHRNFIEILNNFLYYSKVLELLGFF